MSRIAKGLALTSVAAAAVAGTAGIAAADSGASGAAENSPGVLSGNVLQVPVHVPVNLCGNTVDVIGLLNPASAAPASTADAERTLLPAALPGKAAGWHSPVRGIAPNGGIGFQGVRRVPTRGEAPAMGP